MRKKLAFALFAALLAQVYPAAAAPPTDPVEHASGKSSVPGAQVALSANGDPLTGAATGYVVNRWPSGLAYEIRVTCMFIVDNRASIGGEIIASAVFPGHVGSGLVVTIADNTAAGLPDQMGHFLSDVPLPLPGTDCPFPPLMGPDFNIDRGNFQVVGGAPATAEAEARVPTPTNVSGTG
jgi:hypothetical protein